MEKEIKDSDNSEIIKESLDKEDSELEEQIEEENNFIDNERFVEFLQTSVKTKAPVLEKIADVQETINLEQELGFVQTSDEKKTKQDKDFKYNIATNEDEEPKYISSSHEVDLVQYTNIANLGRGKLFQQQEVGFINSQEAQSNSVSLEKYEAVKKIDINKLGKENQFEKEKIFYKFSLNQ